MTKFLTIAVLAIACTFAAAQAAPTATRRADLQLGASFSYANSDYIFGNPAGTTSSGDKYKGFGFYGDLDLKYHLGLEFDFHQLSGKDPINYERTYEVGPRYIFPIHNRFVPYAKVLVGRGVFNFANFDSTGKEIVVANLAYNMYSGGGGLDLKVLPGLNVRLVDFEYQRWPGFPPTAINPKVLSFGVAYHFHGGDRFGQ